MSSDNECCGDGSHKWRGRNEIPKQNAVDNEVRELLGEPDNVDKSTFFEDWTYGVPPRAMLRFSKSRQS